MFDLIPEKELSESCLEQLQPFPKYNLNKFPHGPLQPLTSTYTKLSLPIFFLSKSRRHISIQKTASFWWLPVVVVMVATVGWWWWQRNWMRVRMKSKWLCMISARKPTPKLISKFVIKIVLQIKVHFSHALCAFVFQVSYVGYCERKTS